MLKATNLVGFGASDRFGPPLSLTFEDDVGDGSNLTTYTFTSRAIGTADAERRVIVAVGGSAVTTQCDSVTVGGISATKVVERNGGDSRTASIWIAKVPTGTTANIVVTFGDSAGSCHIYVYSVSGMLNAADETPQDTDNAASINGSPDISWTIDKYKDGIGVAVIANSDNATDTTFSNFTSDSNDSDDFNGYAGGSDVFTATEIGASETASWTGASVNSVGCVASWR